MPYATEQDLIAAAGGPERLEQLVAQAPGRDAWIAQLGEWGDALVNTYLPARFRTPIAHPSPAIRQLAAAEGVYQLLVARGLVTELDSDVAQERRKRLEAMRDGKQWPGDPLPEATRGRQSAFVDNPRAVSRRTLKGFI